MTYYLRFNEDEAITIVLSLSDTKEPPASADPPGRSQLTTREIPQGDLARCIEPITSKFIRGHVESLERIPLHENRGSMTGQLDPSASDRNIGNNGKQRIHKKNIQNDLLCFLSFICFGTYKFWVLLGLLGLLILGLIIFRHSIF